MNYTNKSYKLIGFILPGLILYSIFTIYPIIGSFIYSFTNWNGAAGTARHFVFLKNFRDMLGDEKIYIAIKNNFILVGIGIFIKLPLSMLLAVLIKSKSAKLRRFYRITYFFPCVVATSAVALMWQLIYDPQVGLINSFLNAIGLERYAANWLGNTGSAIFWAYFPTIFVSVGFNFVLFSAAMTMISKDLYESSEIDGASAVRQFFLITLPLLKDIIVISIILDMAAALKAFDIIWIMTKGGPSDSTTLLGVRMYAEAFELFKFGYGSAIAVTIFIISMLYSGLTKILTRKELV